MVFPLGLVSQKHLIYTAVRPLEIIILSSLLWIIYLLFREDKKLFLYSLFGGLLVCFLHFYLESQRWQMAPAYLLFLIIFLFYKKGGEKPLWGKSLILVYFLFSAFLPFVIPVFSLPTPTGSYSIGTQTFQWTDSTRLEWFTYENPNDYRKIMVQVWYPSNDIKGRAPEPYIDNITIRAETIGSAGGFPGWMAGHINLVKTNSYLNASPDLTNAPYPVLILSHGITGMRQIHSALIEELTSHGFVVASLDHPYDCNLTLFQDGTVADYRSDITGHPDSVQIRRKQLNTRVADVRFLLDTLTKINQAIHFNGLMDLNRVGVLGHSYGGATAIQVAFEDKRFRSCLVLDSWMNPLSTNVLNSGISQPFIYLGRPHWDDSDYPTSPNLVNTFTKSSPEKNFQLVLKNSRHLDFCDAPLFSPLTDRFLETGPISAKKAVAITNKVALSFFSYFLKDKQGEFPNDILNEHFLLLR